MKYCGHGMGSVFATLLLLQGAEALVDRVDERKQERRAAKQEKMSFLGVCFLMLGILMIGAGVFADATAVGCLGVIVGSLGGMIK